MVVAGAILASARLPVDFLPPADEGSVLVEYILPPGTSFAESDSFGSRLERMMLAEPEVALTYRRTGSPQVGHQIEGAHRGEILAKLRPRKARTHDAEEIIERFREITDTFEGAVFLHRQPTKEKIDESFSGLPAVFGVTLFGEDLDQLTTAAAEAETLLASCDEVEEVINNTRVRRPEMTVRVDHASLGQYGIDGREVLTALRAALVGEEVVTLLGPRETISVLLHLDTSVANDRGRIPELLLRARSPGNSLLSGSDSPETSPLVPLSKVAALEMRHVPDTISRLNGRRQVTVLAEIEGNLPAVVADLRRRFQNHAWPAGIAWEFSGQYPVLIRTGADLLSAFVLAALLIYAVLVVQFRSLLSPLAILAVTPVSLAGAFLLLAACGQGLDASVGMGLFTLMGISVNNAIILVDFRRRSLEEGGTAGEATAAAVAARLRPVIMTSLTTMAALLPAAMATGGGSRIFQPFAVTVIGGLLAGWVATLWGLPAILSLRSKARPT
jgi:multidrug efflux pump subunit AcrB